MSLPYNPEDYRDKMLLFKWNVQELEHVLKTFRLQKERSLLCAHLIHNCEGRRPLVGAISDAISPYAFLGRYLSAPLTPRGVLFSGGTPWFEANKTLRVMWLEELIKYNKTLEETSNEA